MDSGLLVLTPSKRQRHVDYVADKNGFRAKIRTSEPGTETKNPASVFMEAKPMPHPIMKSATKPTVQIRARNEPEDHQARELLPQVQLPQGN
jgi:hypothetical protein